MERLTKRDPFDGIVELTKEIGEPIAPYNEVIEALSKLAAYEDTGLEPEEIKEKVGFMSPICVGCDGKTADGKRTEKCTYEDGCVKCLERSVHLSELVHAEEQGLLVILPCKVGDTVYRICPKCNDNHEASCDGCAWENTEGVKGCNVFGLWGDGQFPANKCTIVPWIATYHRMPTVIDKLGSRIFLSREEAEAALKGEPKDV